MKAEVLLQNCDLPPPVKLFRSNDVKENQSLLRALRLSQTRAREAEMKAMEARIEAEKIIALMFKESMKLHEMKELGRNAGNGDIIYEAMHETFRFPFPFRMKCKSLQLHRGHVKERKAACTIRRAYNFSQHQIENEYGIIMDSYGDADKRYNNWSAKMAEALNVGVSWIICQ